MPKKGEVGRNTKLTPEMQEAIVQALSVGATHRIACEYAGVIPSRIDIFWNF